MKPKNPYILAASVMLAILIVLISLTGIMVPNFYIKETPDWQAQAIGQDMVDLFLIVPCLIITSVFAYWGSNKAMMLWGGVLSYLIYTFTIYCFAVHFNRLFILYCFTLGLSFYSLIYFFLHWNQQEVLLKSMLLAKVIAIYFFFISTTFFFLWLSEIVPSVTNNTTPEYLISEGLATNPVHVLDLSIFLPALFITATLLFKRKALGFVLVPVFLVFTILMNITIAALQVIMVQRGAETGYSVLIIMTVLAICSVILLLFFLRDISRQFSSAELNVTA